MRAPGRALQLSALAAALGVTAAGSRSRAEGPPASEPDPRPSSSAGKRYESTVTGSRTEQRVVDAPVATEVITRREIEAGGARNVADVLETQPGLNVVRSFAGAGLRLQGLDARYVLILVDGERLTGRTGDQVDLTRLPVEDIERIEIVRGPSSVLYGSDAIGGVVNIITRRGRKPFEAEAQASYGSLNAVDARGGVGFRAGAWSGYASGGWHRRDAWDLDPSDPGTNGSSFDQFEVAGRIERRGETLKLALGADYLQRRMTGVDSSASGAVLDRRNLNEVLSVRAAPELTFAASRLRLSGYYSTFRDQYLVDQRGADALDEYQETREHLGKLDAQYDVALPADHIVSLGVEGMLERLASARLRGGGERLRGAVFAQDQWTISSERRLVAVPAARFDVDSQFGTNFSPKLALRWDPHEAVILRAGYGVGYRAPSFRELLLHFENPSAGYVVDGNPDLRPERSRSVDLSVELAPRPWFWFSLTLFRNDLSDMILAVSVPGEQEQLRYRYANIASAHTQGLQATVRVKPWRELTLEVGYALTDTEDEKERRPLEGRPLHQGTFLAIYQPRWGRWGFTATVRGSLVGQRPFYADRDGDGAIETGQAAPYLFLGARVAADLTRHLTLFVTGENLTGAGDPTYLPIPPRSLFGGFIGRY